MSRAGCSRSSVTQPRRRRLSRGLGIKPTTFIISVRHIRPKSTLITPYRINLCRRWWWWLISIFWRNVVISIKITIWRGLYTGFNSQYIHTRSIWASWIHVLIKHCLCGVKDCVGISHEFPIFHTAGKTNEGH